MPQREMFGRHFWSIQVAGQRHSARVVKDLNNCVLIPHFQFKELAELELTQTFIYLCYFVYFPYSWGLPCVLDLFLVSYLSYLSCPT